MKNKTNENLTQTNDIATKCKLYCVNRGYYDDNFIQPMAGIAAERSPPEISRGYALRVILIRNFIKNFILDQENTCQIISFGAGFDTLFWHLKNLEPNRKIKNNKNGDKNFVLFEIDLESVVNEKLTRIKRRKELDVKFVKIYETYQSDRYKLIPCDIRDIDQLKLLLERSGVDKNKPTLFLAECILVYLEDEEIIRLLSFVSETFQKSIFLDYDPMNFTDKFGEVMKKNLHDAEYDFRAVKCCASVTAHCRKYSMSNFVGALGYSMWEIYMNEISKSVKTKIDSIEPLDEIGLLKDLLTHYCISVGFNFYTSEDVMDYLSFS